jgi:hypothetical protein
MPIVLNRGARFGEWCSRSRAHMEIDDVGRMDYLVISPTYARAATAAIANSGGGIDPRPDRPRRNRPYAGERLGE